MENDVLQKKYQFPKSVGDICRVPAGWKYNYGSKYNQFSDMLLSPQQKDLQTKEKTKTKR